MNTVLFWMLLIAMSPSDTYVMGIMFPTQAECQEAVAQLADERVSCIPAKSV